MKSWRDAYKEKFEYFEVMDCYTILSINDFEKEIASLRLNSKVDSGANVQLTLITTNELLHDTREINKEGVASPVQVYLDCMRLETRGEEIAKAILKHEIIK